MEQQRSRLDLVEPKEIRAALIGKIREYLKEGVSHSHGMSIPCPYDKKHFALHTFTQFNGMELFSCHECGYRYLLIKQDGEKMLINQPEDKQPILLKKRSGRG